MNMHLLLCNPSALKNQFFHIATRTTMPQLVPYLFWFTIFLSKIEQVLDFVMFSLRCGIVLQNWLINCPRSRQCVFSEKSTLRTPSYLSGLRGRPRKVWYFEKFPFYICASFLLFSSKWNIFSFHRRRDLNKRPTAKLALTVVLQVTTKGNALFLSL